MELAVLGASYNSWTRYFEGVVTFGEKKNVIKLIDRDLQQQFLKQQTQFFAPIYIYVAATWMRCSRLYRAISCRQESWNTVEPLLTHTFLTRTRLY